MAPPPHSHPTTPEAEFLRSVLAQIDQTWEDPEPIFDLFRTNLDKLNEALIDAIPPVFEELLAKEFSSSPWRIAAFFNIFGKRIQEFSLGNQAINIEASIAAYTVSLQVRTRDAFPQNWAMTQNNLGNAYEYRIRGERAENLEHAIAAYQAALQVRTRDDFPQDWAMTQGNLAGALVERAQLTDHPDNLDQGIELYQQALQVAAPGSSYYINDQHRLGNALSRRYEHSQNPDDLQGALAAYTAALTAISPEHWDRPQIWHAIPQTQTILGSRLVRQGQWQKGLELLLNSVRQLSTSDDKQAHANALYQTGRAHETLADWENARLYYRDALRLYDHLSDTLGIAHCKLGLGSVLASQGYLEKGLAELETARELYQQLHQGDRAAQVNDLIQAAQMALDSQSREAFV